jgi:hypothetical protein
MWVRAVWSDLLGWMEATSKAGVGDGVIGLLRGRGVAALLRATRCSSSLQFGIIANWATQTVATAANFLIRKQVVIILTAVWRCTWGAVMQ